MGVAARYRDDALAAQLMRMYVPRRALVLAAVRDTKRAQLALAPCPHAAVVGERCRVKFAGADHDDRRGAKCVRLHAHGRKAAVLEAHCVPDPELHTSQTWGAGRCAVLVQHAWQSGVHCARR